MLMDDNDDQQAELWSDALSARVNAVRIIRKKLGGGDPLPGHAGYDEMLKRDADELQAHLGEFTDALVEMYNHDDITKYIHMLRAGHFKQVHTIETVVRARAQRARVRVCAPRGSFPTDEGGWARTARVQSMFGARMTETNSS